MSDFLFNFKSNSQSTECNGNCPLNKFPNAPVTNYTNSDLLYSLYLSYQNSFTPNYIQNNFLYLTNPDNFSNLPPGPANIFVIRHGEDNKDSTPPTNQNTYYTINCNGIKRSVDLPTFINNLGLNGFPISAIVTSNPNMTYQTNNQNSISSMSIRPQQTIELSSWLLNIPLFIFSQQNVSQPYDATTAINIFTNSYLKGKNIIVVFEHDNIQSLINQFAQCYLFFKSGGLENDLNNTTLFNVSTQSWWELNSPIKPEYQYPGLQYNQSPPLYPIPYINYSNLLPYWNTNNFDMVYWFSQNEFEFKFKKIFFQNINTCFINCKLIIGLLQYSALGISVPGGDNAYSNDTDCLPP